MRENMGPMRWNCGATRCVCANRHWQTSTGDADLDLYLVQSGRVDRTLPDELSRNRLYKNRGDGHFDEVAGAAGAGDRGYGMGVAAGDYDNDGAVDLYVTNLGANVLLQNDGTGTFKDVTRDSGVGDPRWSTAATFLDLVSATVDSRRLNRDVQPSASYLASSDPRVHFGLGTRCRRATSSRIGRAVKRRRLGLRGRRNLRSTGRCRPPP